MFNKDIVHALRNVFLANNTYIYITDYYLTEIGFHNFGNTCYASTAINILKRLPWFRRITENETISKTATLLKKLMELNINYRNATVLFVSFVQRIIHIKIDHF